MDFTTSGLSDNKGGRRLELLIETMFGKESQSLYILNHQIRVLGLLMAYSRLASLIGNRSTSRQQLTLRMARAAISRKSLTESKYCKDNLYNLSKYNALIRSENKSFGVHEATSSWSNTIPF